MEPNGTRFSWRHPPWKDHGRPLGPHWCPLVPQGASRPQKHLPKGTPGHQKCTYIEQRELKIKADPWFQNAGPGLMDYLVPGCLRRIFVLPSRWIRRANALQGYHMTKLPEAQKNVLALAGLRDIRPDAPTTLQTISLGRRVTRSG